MSSHGYLEVKNWEQFQHYKDRNPPWIKLHAALLDDYEFASLQDASKAHLMGIWILASKHDNKVPADPEWIARRIGATSPVDLEVLISAGFVSRLRRASDPLPERKQSAIPETEVETETEERQNQLVELRTNLAVVRSQPAQGVEAIHSRIAAFAIDTAERGVATLRTEARRRVVAGVVFVYWAGRFGHPKAMLDPGRERRIMARLAESGDNLDEMLYALDGAAKDPWIMGRDAKSPKKYDGIETVLRDRAQVERFASACPGYVKGEPHPSAEKFLRGAATEVA